MPARSMPNGTERPQPFKVSHMRSLPSYMKPFLFTAVSLLLVASFIPFMNTTNEPDNEARARQAERRGHTAEAAEAVKNK